MLRTNSSVARLRFSLKQEREVYRIFSASKRLSNAEVFATVGSNEEPHWNLLYPRFDGGKYEKKDLLEAGAFFRDSQVKGHVLLIGDEMDRWKKPVVEEVEYFSSNPDCAEVQGVRNVEGFAVLPDSDLDLFCEMVGKAFGYDAKTIKYFKEKMMEISAQLFSQFFIFTKDDVPCGTASTFRSGEDGVDYLFNVGVLPDFSGQGIASNMLKVLLMNNKGVPVHTYSEVASMRQRILPRAGMQSLGTAFVVTLDDFIRENS